MAHRRRLALTAPLLAAALTSLAPSTADAFCGFYVAGADAKLFNDATVVVLMRNDTRTVLSMRNDYQGPPEAFALVIPVPVVLQEDEVKTLRKELFERVETLSSPRLVEYWEQDPCDPMEGTIGLGNTGLIGRGGGGGAGSGYGRGPASVVVEAEFAVGEYEIVILSAKESNGLDAWLRANDYNIPEGAEPLLRPYVEQGMKFFVAKVDPKKVEFDERGRTRLSPLRFHYDSEQFSLPIRLGMINAPDAASGGKQDLIVHILAPQTRYQTANYKNVTIPTNLDVKDEVRDQFGSFYASLFDHTLSQNPGAVVTEYSWGSSSCDPCPGPDAALTAQEVAELGADALGGDLIASGPGLTLGEAKVKGKLDAAIIRRIVRAHRNEVRSCYAQGLSGDPKLAGEAVIEFQIDGEEGTVESSAVKRDGPGDGQVASCIAAAIKRWKFPRPMDRKDVKVDFPFTLEPQQVLTSGLASGQNPFVLTRLHARYDQSSLGEDLVFEATTPIAGGREFFDGEELERGAQPSPVNNFQARYAIRHPWTGAIECEDPTRGMWGGPPAGQEGSTEPAVARDLAQAKRGASLASFVSSELAAELGTKPAPPSDEVLETPEDAGEEGSKPADPTPPPTTAQPPGCACSSSDSEPLNTPIGIALGLLALAGLARRRRPQR